MLVNAYTCDQIQKSFFDIVDSRLVLKTAKSEVYPTPITFSRHEIKNCLKNISIDY
jgi:hypothetical protein